jgi:hypothetical protein
MCEKLREEIAPIWLDYDKKVKEFMLGNSDLHPSFTDSMDKTIALMKVKLPEIPYETIWGKCNNLVKESLLKQGFEVEK